MDHVGLYAYIYTTKKYYSIFDPVPTMIHYPDRIQLNLDYLDTWIKRAFRIKNCETIEKEWLDPK